MKYKHHNLNELKKIIKLINRSPYEANQKLKEYLENYASDYNAYPFYITTLITLRRLDEAEKLLDEINNKNINHKNYTNDQKSIELFNIHMLQTKVKLLSYQEKYEELYYLCKKNQQILKEADLNNVLFYISKKHGDLKKQERTNHPYLFKQIIEYKEEDFLEHIKRYSDNENIDISNKSVFSKDFPNKQILEEIKKQIPNNLGLYINFYDDVYLFRYDNCCKINNIPANYFAVVCFHGTKDIITIYPTMNQERLPSINLNYLIQETTETKIKRLSQTDKFNQKYRRQ